MSKRAMKTSAILAGLVLSGAATAGAMAADVAGSSDHPILPRYEGAEIVRYDHASYDAYHLLFEAATAYGGINDNLQHTLPLEGEVTEITYLLPEDRSPLEVMRNYVLALDGLGFEIIYQCAAEECGGRNFNHAAVPYVEGLGDNYGEQRYVAAVLNKGEHQVYLSLYVTANNNSGGPTRGYTYAKLDLIELEAMDINIQIIDSAQIADELSATGHVALHAIMFEFDSAVLRPEANDQLAEMAAHIQARPDAEFIVVGHTDNQGGVAYNLALSQQRAEAVVQALASGYGVDAGMLIPVGVGMAAPMASNASDLGQAQNRRVELVLK